MKGDMFMKLLDIGFGNTVNADRIIAIASADAAPIKRMISAAKEKNLAIDTTCGRKTKSVVIMDSGHVVMSAREADKLNEKVSTDGENEDE